jgi:hypothetical protein
MGIPGCVGPVSDGDRCELDYREGNGLSGRYWHSPHRQEMKEREAWIAHEERQVIRGELHDRYATYVDCAPPGSELLSFDEWINS